MTETELKEYAISDWPESARERILERLADNNPEYALNDFSEYRCTWLDDIWPRLDLSQRLILYVVAEANSSCSRD